MRNLISIISVIFILCTLNAQEEGTSFLNGMVQFSMGNNKESIEAFSQSIKAGDQIEKSYLNRGIAYLKTEQYSLAEADFNQVREFENPLALLWLAKLHALNNNPALSTRYIEDFL